MTRTLRRLDLDFRAARPAAPWAAWLMLALAIGFVADLGVSYRDMQLSVERTQMRLAKTERFRDGTARARAGSQAIAPEEIATARETYLRLATPWNDLFTTLESTLSEGVTLVAIEPDTKAGTVMVSGEGRDYATVLAYVAALQRAKLFERVYLVRHELRQTDQQHSAAFVISAKWSDAR